MAVQMILRHVQAGRDVRAKSFDRFQLKAGKLQHVPLPGPRRFHHLGRRVPMLPPTWHAIPLSRRICPVNAVVVVLPLVPVIPMFCPSRNGAASSSSPITGTPRARTGASRSRSAGTPGEITTSSASSKCRFRLRLHCHAFHSPIGFSSTARTTGAVLAQQTARPPRQNAPFPPRQLLLPSSFRISVTAASKWSARTAPSPVPQSKTA